MEDKYKLSDHTITKIARHHIYAYRRGSFNHRQAIKYSSPWSSAVQNMDSVYSESMLKEALDHLKTNYEVPLSYTLQQFTSEYSIWKHVASV